MIWYDVCYAILQYNINCYHIIMGPEEHMGAPQPTFISGLVWGNIYFTQK